MTRQKFATAIFACWLAFAGAASGDCLDADRLAPLPAPAIPELGEASGELSRASGGRMVAPMMVNGQGPFRFIVDTGANRSAISDRLDLQASTVPIVEGAVLGGEQGLLGVDGMQGRRLRVDFENRCIEITPADRRMRRGNGWMTIEGELRFGHLVVIEGHIRGQDVHVIIDTGSDSTLANPAFRDQLRNAVRVTRDRSDYARAYTAGSPIVMDSAVLIPRLNLGGVQVRDVTAYVADFHIFRLWGFVDEPALLIGMDVLSQTRAIAIDYERGTVHFRLPRRVRTGSRLPGGNSAGVIIER
jgi:predicted aspartyl protease